MISALFKNPVLLIEGDNHTRSELTTFLQQNFEVTKAASVEQAIRKMERCSAFFAIITNMNLHQSEHFLMDGLSIVRYAQCLPSIPIPTIVYSYTLHPLAEREAHAIGAYKLLDQSDPDFKSKLIHSLFSIVKINTKKINYEVSNADSIIVKSLLRNFSYVKPIQWNSIDENLYNSFFRIDTQSHFRYANSWAYVCQAARENGYKYFNGNCLITLIADRHLVNQNLQFTIINPLGTSSVRNTIELASKLKQISGNPVILKKIAPKQIRYYLETKHCQLIQHPRSTRLEDQFDDIHPQVIVNLNAFINNLTSNRKLVNFQRNLKKFSQRNHTTQTIQPELFDHFLEVVRKWKQSFIKRYESRTVPEFTDIPHDDDYYLSPYFPIFEYYSRYVNNKDILSSLVYVDNIPVGFSFLSNVSPTCMGMYANIGDTDVEGLAEFMLYQNLTKAYWSGYKYVNLGGTESHYLYEFYRKLKLDYGVEKSFEIYSRYLVFE
ncbi:hypothetical protein JW960_02955 [candidate division KSB1 bacterium]|nr:hypothetical protein [candidate division KSB1 bacterium]